MTKEINTESKTNIKTKSKQKTIPNKKLPKDVAQLKKRALKVSFIILIGFNIAGALLKKPEFIASSIVGWSCSYLILDNLVKTQVNLLITKQKSTLFLNFISRLGLYAIPIILSFSLKEYLNLIIILIFLLSNQITWIVLEGISNYKHLKNRLKKDKNN
jgi:hypothetical protein